MSIQSRHQYFLKEFADKIPVGLLLVDRAAVCSVTNAHWTVLTDFTADESIAHGWLQSIHPKFRNEFERKLRVSLEQRSPFDEEVEIVTPDGIVKWLEMSASPLESDHSSPDAFMIVATDITDRKGSESDLRRSEEGYRKIVNRASDLICEISTDGLITFVNPVIEKILKYRPKEIVGRYFLDLVHPSFKPSALEFYRRQIRELTEQTYFEFQAVDRDGARVWLGQNVTISFRGERVVGFQAFAREITDQKMAERRHRVQDAVVRILGNEDSVGTAVERILEAIGSIIGFQAAAWWQFNEVHTGLICRSVWRDSDERFKRYKRTTGALSFRHDEGIPGRVLTSRSAMWIEHLHSDLRFLRNEVCHQDGLRSGFWFPVLLGNTVLGVIEFLSETATEEDPDLLLLMSNIGSQIGQFIQRKRAERDLRESDARKSAILESALDCVITIDHKGRIIEFNPAAERTFGYRRDEAIGQIMGDLIVPSDYRDAHHRGIRRFVESGQHAVLKTRIEIEAVRKDGSRFPIELAITPIERPDSPPMFTGYLRDITERRIAEEELRQAKDQAEAASDAKSQFLAVMSHEIRTPLNAIIGLSDLAVATESDEERRNFVGTIQENSENLLLLINDILDFSKIEAKQIDIEHVEFDLRDVIERAVEMFAFKAFAKGLELVAVIDNELPAMVIGDPGRVRQVLVNLISNAVKFTERGQIAVRATVLNPDGDQVEIRFRVQDSGIGIPESKIATIFERFSQADISTTRKYGGTGLGLSISRSLLNLMAGDIKVKSEPGAGSEFEFTLSLPVRKGKEALECSSQFAGKNVLIVDDHPLVHESILEILKDFRGGIMTTSSASEAVALVRSAPFDLVIIDQTLVDLNDHELAQLVKANSAKADVKTILLTTAGRSPGGRHESLDGVVSKPVRRRELCRVIMGLFDIKSVCRTEATSSVESARHLPVRVLLAEDSKANQEIVVRILQRAGHSIEIAENGRDAVEKFEKGSFDLILMDIEMPEMDGFQATTEIRARETGSRTPIIALTAHALQGYHEKCLAFGMDDYLVKPLRRERLLQTIDEYVTGSHAAASTQGIVLGIDPDIIDLVPDYLENCREAIAEIREAMRRSDLQIVKRLGHNFKGSGSGYGFAEITQFGTLIEEGAKSGDSESIEKAVEDLERFLSQVQFVPI